MSHVFLAEKRSSYFDEIFLQSTSKLWRVTERNHAKFTWKLTRFSFRVRFSNRTRTKSITQWRGLLQGGGLEAAPKLRRAAPAANAASAPSSSGLGLQDVPAALVQRRPLLLTTEKTTSYSVVRSICS